MDVDGAELEILEGFKKHIVNVRELFIELSLNLQYACPASFLSEKGFSEISRHPVRKPEIGYHEELFNIIFRNTNH